MIKIKKRSQCEPLKITCIRSRIAGNFDSAKFRGATRYDRADEGGWEFPLYLFMGVMWELGNAGEMKRTKTHQ